jgi:endonuclease/exonuclease/phosphatase family metal-dependent hydrolase
MTPSVQREPAYYSFESIPWRSLPARTLSVALPFLALHKPWGRVITLLSESSHSISNLHDLYQKPDAKKVFKTCVGVAAVAATYFAHPVGLGIVTLYELIQQLPQALHSQEALLACLHQATYLGVLTIGSLEIVAAGLLLSLALEALKAKSEWKKDGRFLEAAAHLLMSGVRLGQGISVLSEKYTSIRPLANQVARMRDVTSTYLYQCARLCVDPMWTSTRLWLKTISVCKDSQTRQTQKIASMAGATLASLALLPFTLTGVVAGHIFHFAAFTMATKPFTHLKGAAPEEREQLSTFQLNCCLTAGGFASLFGGLALSDEERRAKIAEIIRAENPDLVALQEVSDPKSAFALYEALKDKYHDFYLNMGMTPWILQNNSGLFVASKAPVTSARFESFKGIPGTESMVNKGYFAFHLRDLTLINTHLSPSSDDLHPTELEIAARTEEQNRILRENPTLVFADFNTSQGPLFDRATTTVSGTASETDYLKERNFSHNPDAQPTENLIIDHALSFGPSLTGRAIATFDTNDPREALSDHPAILSTK